MTDSDISKALDTCANKPGCRTCPYDRLKIMECSQTMMRDAIALIKRQQEEIERLKTENDAFIRNYKECVMEAVKDFAERLKAKAYKSCEGWPIPHAVDAKDIGETAAGMEGKHGIKPCPCCGETSVYIERVCANTSTGYLYYVRCGNIPYCGLKQNGFHTEKDAVEAWNRRADDAQ